MRFLFFLVISALCHAAVYAWLLRAFPRLRSHKKALLITLGVIVTLVPLGRLVIYRIDSGVARIVTAFAMTELLVAMITMLPLALVGLLGHLIQRRSPAPEPEPEPNVATVPEAEPEPQPVTRRQLFERTAGLAIVGSSGVSIAWGAVRGRLDFQIEEVVVKIPGLPKSLEGYTIAQVSDIHVGVFVKEHELRRGFELVARTKPDLIVATGDLVDFDPRFIALMARSLGDLRARDGVAAILGNHDYYTGGPEIYDALKRAGVRALVNEHVVLRPGDGGGIVLGGVDDYAGARHGTDGPDLAHTFAGAPDAPRILLAHQPQYFDDARGHVALQLSGHVHGGQVNPIIVPAEYVLKYVAGRYQERGSTMWVNRGFGTAGPPARVGSPPEISKIVLVSG